MDPFGGLQVLLSGQVEPLLLIPTIIAVLIFVILIVLLGNVFCSWVCPVGTIIDSFDKFVEKCFPNIEAKRNKRSQQRKERKQKEEGSSLGCPLCPLHKINGFWRMELLHQRLLVLLFSSFLYSVLFVP